MAYTLTGQNVTLEAGQDLSSSQYFFVAVAADGQSVMLFRPRPQVKPTRLLPVT